jgi:hypothetical protein
MAGTKAPSGALARRPRAALAMLALVLAGCAATPPARTYLKESFTLDSPFQYYSSREPAGACEIGKRALLSQGYQIDGAQTLIIRGEKYFQPQADLATKLTITLVCLPSSLGAVIYANALETQYELKSRGSSAGFSLSGMGSLSLPWAADKDSLVKTGDQTVTAPEFYQKLFELIKTLDG